MSSVILAVDFDGTLCKDAYPAIGEPNFWALHAVKKAKENGAKLILWTCRCGQYLDQAVGWCLAQGITFDAINENLPEIVAKYGTNCRKIFADYYLDDKNISVDLMIQHPERIERRMKND